MIEYAIKFKVRILSILSTLKYVTKCDQGDFNHNRRLR
jgi:hypothetical protein